MSTLEKLYMSIMSGTQDKNVKFRDIQSLLDALGFQYRVRGDHFIYYSIMETILRTSIYSR